MSQDSVKRKKKVYFWSQIYIKIMIVQAMMTWDLGQVINALWISTSSSKNLGSSQLSDRLMWVSNEVFTQTLWVLSAEGGVLSFCRFVLKRCCLLVPFTHEGVLVVRNHASGKSWKKEYFRKRQSLGQDSEWQGVPGAHRPLKKLIWKPFLNEMQWYKECQF